MTNPKQIQKIPSSPIAWNPRISFYGLLFGTGGCLFVFGHNTFMHFTGFLFIMTGIVIGLVKGSPV